MSNTKSSFSSSILHHRSLQPSIMNEFRSVEQYLQLREEYIRSRDDDQMHEDEFECGEVVTQELRDDIDKIRNNDPTKDYFTLTFENNSLSLTGWKLIGRYIASNTHLKGLDFSGIYPNMNDLSYFFSELQPGSLSSTNLKHIHMVTIDNTFGTKCFDIMMRALSGGPIENVTLENENIDSIAVLDEVELPHLQDLCLSGNKIVCTSGIEKCLALETLYLNGNPINLSGCVGIAKLLESSSTLKEFVLGNNSFGDEGADMLASSLKHNNTLYLLEMDEKMNMTEKGRVSFLKLLCDISSIKRTYNSNHTLTDVLGIASSKDHMVQKYIDLSAEKNETMNEAHAISRSKVIEFQLNSEKREDLHRLQGIEYCYSSIFAEIDPLVLPDVLALVGREHGQTELFRMLVNSVSDLFSTVNRKMIVKQKIAEKEDAMASLKTQMAILSAEASVLNTELEYIEKREREQDKRTRDGRLKR